jgi:tRNA(Ser,Leu) C12 N-acetylase TAN1
LLEKEYPTSEGILKWKVDLKSPDWVFVVSVFKSVAGLSPLPNYFGKYKKFNLSQFIASSLN